MNANEIKALKLQNKRCGVEVFVAGSYEALSKKAASIVAGAINQKPKFLLGLATGTSPIGLYEELANLNHEGRVDFSGVTTYNLDEYYPIDPANDQSYRYFMNKHLFNNINIDMDNTHVLFGQAPDWKVECETYDKAIADFGGIDLQVLGIGNNGHIGFNEPGKDFIWGTHRVELTESTIEANSRLFNSADEVPRAALSMGIGNIMCAKQVVLVANGPKKAQAIKDALEGEISPYCQASILQLHKNVTFILDEEAASMLDAYKAL